MEINRILNNESFMAKLKHFIGMKRMGIYMYNINDKALFYGGHNVSRLNNII